jgi:hypothetical protein
MKPTSGSDREALEAAQREAIRHAHPYEEPPKVPEGEVETIATAELAAHSPDGRPADRPSRTRGRLVLLGLLGLGMPAVVFGVWKGGGWDALLMGLVYVFVMMLVGYPVWYSGMIRAREEHEASEIVRQTLSAERFGTTGKAR